jgi:hypothetical protein
VSAMRRSARRTLRPDRSTGLRRRAGRGRSTQCLVR